MCFIVLNGLAFVLISVTFTDYALRLWGSAAWAGAKAGCAPRGYAPATMTPEQARVMKEELHGVDQEIRSITEGQDGTGLETRPGSSSWSVAENLQHLILTAEAMLPLIDDAVAKLERAGGKASRPSGLGFMGWMLVKALEPPPRMKSRTSKPFEPLATGDPLTLADRLRATNVKLGALIDRASGLPTSAVKIASPFDARVKYNVYAALRITLVHARRHLWQAREARASAR